MFDGLPKLPLRLALLALIAGITILVIDWLLVLDTPGERIRESVVSDIGGAALVITGIVILTILRAQKRDAERFQADGLEAEAVVETVRLGFFGTDVTIRFDDAGGTSRTARLQGSNLSARPGFGPGTRVSVRYDPANPADLRFQDTLDTLAPRT